MFEAHQWYRNGDHPNDNCRVITPEPVVAGVDLACEPVWANGNEFWSEGEVVRYFRHPEIPGDQVCECGKTMHLHGWIEPDYSVGIRRTSEFGTIVCPGDMIISRWNEDRQKIEYESRSYAEFWRRYRQVGYWPSCVYVERGTRLWEKEHPHRTLVSHFRRQAGAKLYHALYMVNLRIARRTPRRLADAIVIARTCEYSFTHPQAEVPAISAIDLIKNGSAS